MRKIDSESLVEEVCMRIKGNRRSRLAKDELQELVEALTERGAVNGLVAEAATAAWGIPNTCLHDVQKLQHLAKVWDRYTPEDFERLLP